MIDLIPCRDPSGSAMLDDMNGSFALARIAVTPSPVTRHAELLRLCARIGYSPPHR